MWWIQNLKGYRVQQNHFENIFHSFNFRKTENKFDCMWTANTWSYEIEENEKH